MRTVSGGVWRAPERLVSLQAAQLGAGAARGQCVGSVWAESVGSVWAACWKCGGSAWAAVGSMFEAWGQCRGSVSAEGSAGA
eukprot:361573-Chlamydomonas_euryale.AAC.2